MDMLARIKANTDLVIAQLAEASGIAFGLNTASLAYLEGFIERQRARGLSAGATDRLVSVFGSFLGECIVANYGGRWVEHDHGWAINLDGRVLAFPFAKVRKLFDGGLDRGESIVGFFEAIPLFLGDRVDA